MNPGVIFECAFDITYLVTVFTIGIIMFCNLGNNMQYTLFAWMCVLLAGGDCFHLIPRIISKFKKENANVTAAIGYGNVITGISMTVFYVIFMELLAIRYGLKLVIVRPLVYILLVCRVITLVLPQNDWKHNTFNRTMSIIRNTPFTLIGLIVVVLLFMHTWGKHDDVFRFFSWLVIVSFGCYLPVAIIHFEGPINAVFMIVKTIAYVALILIGFFSLSPSIQN